MKEIGFFNYSLNSEVTPVNGGTIVVMQGYSRFKDYYLCVPCTGIHYRAANCARYGQFKAELFIDGEFVGATRKDKLQRITRLYEAGEIDEAKQYALGYMLWRETSLGGNKTNPRKAAARLSHQLCDASGKAGHDARQYIRRCILRGENVIL